jgi:DNA polymerase/3'-5' exonuclease PolX
MSQGQRYPHAQAMAVAVDLCLALDPLVERIQIVGSLRRCKPDVGDIEILFIGKKAERQRDLLSVEQYDLAWAKVDQLLTEHVLTKRPNTRGIFTWGEQNRLAIHVASGIPVDFFSTSLDCWWNSLVCRTGGKENNLLITTTAKRQGWTFEACSRSSMAPSII